jgi:hypothetical protein
MSAVEKRVAARPKGERRRPLADDAFMPAPVDLSPEDEVERVPNQGVLLPADPRLFAPRALAAVRRGRFERRAARQRQGLLRGDDRLLEIGAGIGFLPILSVLAHPGLVVRATEARADLAAVGRRIAAAHGIGKERLEILPADDAAAIRELLAGFAPTVVVLNDPRFPPAELARALTSCTRRVVLAERSDRRPVADLGLDVTAEGAWGVVLDRS